MIYGYEKSGRKDTHVSENLRHYEVMCKCAYSDCTYTLLDQRALKNFEFVRADVGGPINIRSWYRCQRHNKDVGGVDASRHVRGEACDLECPKGMLIQVFTMICGKYFDVVIPYPDLNFVHCHNNPSFK